MKTSKLYPVLFLLAGALCSAKETKVELPSVGFEVVVPDRWSYPNDPVQPYSNSRTDCLFMKEGKAKALTVQVTTRTARALSEEDELAQAWKKSGPKDVPEPLLHREKIALMGRNCLRGWFVDPTGGINGVAYGFCIFIGERDVFSIQLFCAGKDSPFEDAELATIFASLRTVPRKKPNQSLQPNAGAAPSADEAFPRVADLERSAKMKPLRENPYRGREAVMFEFACSAEKDGEHFFYVRIPGNIGVEERGDRFEDPLQAALEKDGIGWVAGGGSQLGVGTSIEFCGVDVFAKDRAAALRILTQELRRLGAPEGTVIEEYLPTRIDHPVCE